MVNFQGPDPAGDFCTFERDAYNDALWERENARIKYVSVSTQTDPVTIGEPLSIEQVED